MPPRQTEPEQALPAKIGRFEVVDRLGQGGMGQVLRARDPRLGREVAIKLLHAEVSRESAPQQAEVARQRLVREAQAMARLDHPNVIGVHEVGDDDGQVFLVMERVSGTTLTRWLAAAPRGWREVLAVFAQVGAGLAAAHSAGLVHRDVKPDNVLVGDDGRVRVTDFGLVGVDEPAPSTARGPAAIADVDPTGNTLTPALTHEGALVGTPGYMAPEQWRGEGADARSDQFALCVALYHALFGQPPFVGPNLRTLAVAVLDGQVRPPPADTDVPPAITAAVLRGLAVLPDARWPDVPALMTALAAAAIAPAAIAEPPAIIAAAPRRARWGQAAAVAIILGGGLTTWRLTRHRAPPPPPPAPAAVASSWPLPASAVETLISSGACDSSPVPIDDRTLVYRHLDHTGVDLRVRDLVSGVDRGLTTTPDVDEMAPQPAVGERAVVAILRELTSSGAGANRIDVDTGAVTPLPGSAGIYYGPGASTAGGALYYVLGGGSQLMELRDGATSERVTIRGGGIGGFTIGADGRTAALFTSAGLCMLDLTTRAEPVCHDQLDGPYGKPGLDDAGRVYYAGLAGLRRFDPATGEDVVLVRDRGANGGLAVRRDGGALYFSECQPQMEITRAGDDTVVHAESLTRAQRNRRGAWVFIRETPSSSLLTFLDGDGLVHVLTRAEQGTATEPALEPDGDRIVFFLLGPESGLYLASGQSHRPLRRLTEQAMGGAIWVDDGHVAATATHDDGLPYIHLVDVDTGEDRQALPRPRITLDRQPDGDTILVASDDRLRLFLWEPATGRERELPLPVEVSHRPIIDADLAVGARSVDVVVGPEVWTVPILGPGRTGPATRAYAPPAHKSFWGNELGADGQRYVLLGEERGDLYRITLPR